MDWEARGHVNAVKSQGECGSCWAFAAVDAIESAMSIKTNQKYRFSTQEIVDCASETNDGCSGGAIVHALEYVEKQGGLCTEVSYPYEATNGTCRASQCEHLCISPSVVHVPPNSESALLSALSQQPVAVAIETSVHIFQFYGGGVVTSHCGANVNHGLLAVGFGVTDQGTPYWKLKNSWGASWGEDGYVRLARNPDMNGGHGQCGVLREPLYPKL